MELTLLHGAVFFFIGWNIISLIITANDKRKSMMRGGQDRTPEGLLFFLAVAFGSVGVYSAMILFRHKTKKWYFQVGIPLLIIQNLATLAFIIGWLDSL